VTTRFDEKSMF